MARPTSKTLTEAEQRVMRVLWDVGEASVRSVATAWNAERPVAYNTVQTILSILHRKGYVQFRREGRAYIYRAVVSQAEARREAFENLLTRFFGGSRNAFAQYLMEEEDVSAVELAALRKMMQTQNDDDR